MGKNTKPAAKAEAPKVEEQAPKVEETAPAAEVTAPVKEESAPAPEAPKVEEQAASGISEAIEATFKARPDLKVAYVNGPNFFFDERQAKRSLKVYETIENPFITE